VSIHPIYFLNPVSVPDRQWLSVTQLPLEPEVSQATYDWHSKGQSSRTQDRHIADHMCAVWAFKSLAGRLALLSHFLRLRPSSCFCPFFFALILPIVFALFFSAPLLLLSLPLLLPGWRKRTWADGPDDSGTIALVETLLVRLWICCRFVV